MLYMSCASLLCTCQFLNANVCVWQVSIHISIEEHELDTSYIEDCSQDTPHYSVYISIEEHEYWFNTNI